MSFFSLGLLLGIFRILPQEWLEFNIGFYVLCLLMFTVGVSVGHNKKTFSQFKSLHLGFLLLPIGTMLGTFSGILAVSVLLKERTIPELFAIGSGFGYYSLSSILITEYKGAELGAIALMTNITREVFTLVLTPWMVKYFGKLSPISAGGATTMDTTFPIIMQYSGNKYAVVSIYHGFVMDFSVPFLVTFFC